MQYEIKGQQDEHYQAGIELGLSWEQVGTKMGLSWDEVVKYQLYDKKIVMDEAKMDSVGWKIQIK